MTTLLPTLLMAAVLGGEARWPGYLNSGQPAPVDPAALPVTWGPDENVAWRADLPGYGQSSPVVWGETVYLTAVEGPNKESCIVLALDLADGGMRWEHRIDSSDPVKSSVYVSRAAPTAAVDAEGVYAFFESGDLVATNHAGEERWRRSLQADYGKVQSGHGLAASPAQDDDSLFLLVDNDGPSYLLAVDKETGKTQWKTDRASRISWSSPILLDTPAGPAIVVSSSGSVDGYDPSTGALLWSFDDLGGNTVASPLGFGAGRVLVGASPGRRGERAAEATKSNLALEVKATESGPAVEVAWRNRRATSSFGSPMAHAGHVYYVNSTGVVACLDAESGETRYTERLPESCWATPIGVGDRVYFPGKDGTTTVLAAGPEYRVVAENRTWSAEAVKVDPNVGQDEPTEERRRAAGRFAGPVQYAMIAVGDRILLRTGTELVCIRSAGE